MSEQVPQPQRRALPRDAWTSIAERARAGVASDVLRWSPLPRALLTIGEARRLAAIGVIVMAHRHHDHHVELVVRPAVQPAALKVA